MQEHAAIARMLALTIYCVIIFSDGGCDLISDLRRNVKANENIYNFFRRLFLPCTVYYLLYIYKSH